MNARTIHPAYVPLALALLFGIAAGCSSQDKGLDRGEAATTGLQNTRKELTEADAQIEATLSSLRALSAGGRGLAAGIQEVHR